MIKELGETDLLSVAAGWQEAATATGIKWRIVDWQEGALCVHIAPPLRTV